MAQPEGVDCPVCEVGRLEPFLDAGELPVHIGVPWPTRAAALAAPRGRMRPGMCHLCGFVYNVAFDPSLVNYAQRYDAGQQHSPAFQTYSQALAARLVDTYDIRDTTVVELGCGSGFFLGLLCRMGTNHGVGFFDPSGGSPPIDPDAAECASFVREPYARAGCAYRARLTASRYVLEHLPAPRPFLATISGAVRGVHDAVVFAEMPNGLFVLRGLSIWDLMYEHCAYYVPCSVDFLFRSTGFEVLAVTETYSGQALQVEARVGTETDTSPPPPRETEQLARDTEAFAEHFEKKVDEWRQRLHDFAEAGARVVAWGAGGKAVGFFNMLNVRSRVDVVVDVNPSKWGTFLAGTGQEIVAPEALGVAKPDVVIVMNPIYEAEIRHQMASLGLHAETVTV